MNQQIINHKTVNVKLCVLQGKRAAPFYYRKDVLLFSNVAIKVVWEFKIRSNIAALKISSTLCVSIYTARTMYYVHN